MKGVSPWPIAQAADQPINKDTTSTAINRRRAAGGWRPDATALASGCWTAAARTWHAVPSGEPGPERRVPDPPAASVAGAGVRRDDPALGGPGHETWAARPLDPIAFEVRPGIRDSGWPFDRAHLDPYYAEAQKLCQLGPFDYDPGPLGRPDTHATLAPAAGRGDHAIPARHRRLRGNYQDLVRAPNVTLLLHASVVDLATGRPRPGGPDRGPARRRHALLRAGTAGRAGRRRDREPAPAAQPTGAPPRARQRRDLVARFFAERMSTRTGYVVPATPELVGGAGLYAVHAAVPGVRVQWALRVRAAAQRERQLLTAQSSYGA